MEAFKKHPKLLKVVLGIFAFGALLFVAFQGYHFGVWLKDFL